MKEKVFVLGFFILVCLGGLVAAIPYPANIIPAALATDITDTTNTTVYAAAAGVRYNLIHVSVTNNDASVGTVVKVFNGATLVARHFAAANGGGFVIDYPAAIRGAVNTAWTVQAETTSAQLQVTMAAEKQRA